MVGIQLQRTPTYPRREGNRGTALTSKFRRVFDPAAAETVRYGRKALMERSRFAFCSLAIVLFAGCLHAQEDNPDARPPVTKADIDIVRRAAQILNSPGKWNRADNRECPPDAKTISLYCALEKATEEGGKNFEHRGAAMQEARFVIEEIAPDANRYSHRLMDYNNDPKTSFVDIQG